MQTQAKIRTISIISSFLVFIFGFLILHNKTGEVFNSFFMAVLAALMVWITFVIMGWLAQIFIK